MTLAAVRPDDLREAGRTLRAAGCRLRDAQRLTAGTLPASLRWRGLAAAVHARQVESLARAIGCCSEPLDRVAVAVERFAALAEEGQLERERLVCRYAELVEVRRRLLVRTPPPEDPERLRHQAALREVARQLLGIESGLERLEEQLEAARRGLAGELDASRPPSPPPDLMTLVRLGTSIGGAVGGLRRIHLGVSVLVLSARYARSVDLGARLLLTARVRELVTVIERAPWWAKRLGRLGPLSLLASVAVPAWRDVATGGGHDGVRAVLTRVSGVLGLAGAGALALPVPVPHLKAGGAIALGAHGVWKAGSWVYDNRELVGRLGGVLWEDAKRRAAELGDLLGPTPLLPWGPLGPLPPLLGTGDGWDGLRDLLPDLPDLDELRERLPGGGRVPDLPDLPLGPVIRVPVVPLPGSPLVPVPFDPFGWFDD